MRLFRLPANPGALPVSIGRSARRGAAVVEMALVAPLLFTLILCTIEFGRAVMVANILTMAAREGARAGCVPGSANSEVTAAVNNELTGGGIPTGQVTTTIQVDAVTKDVSTAAVGSKVSVAVSVPVSAVTWLPSSFFLSSTAKLSGQAVMRRE